MKFLRIGFVPMLVIVIAVSGCVPGNVSSLPTPPEVSVPPTSSQFLDVSDASIPTVPGEVEDPAVEVKGGNARISGRAVSNGAPLANTVVRIDRFVGTRFGSLEIRTNENGDYAAGDLLGGRFRIRAFRAPDASMNEAQIFFLGRGEQRNVELQLERFNGALDLRYSVNPDPPILGQPSNMTLTFTTRGVDGAGTARSVGAPGLQVRITAGAGRQLTSPPTSTTNDAGRVSFGFVCTSQEAQGLTATLEDGSTYNVNISRCSPPPTTTTTTAPPPDEQVPTPTISIPVV